MKTELNTSDQFHCIYVNENMQFLLMTEKDHPDPHYPSPILSYV